ncbi:MAG: hypothetical protein QOD68_667 [Actinomycetota bacterium]|nr:hypothetical protein [Actinomycetota bacterium]
MTDDDAKRGLHRYLRQAREAMVWKLNGLSEYDVRRPLTPTGTNLLGLVKHLSIVEAWYFGKTFDRPFAEDLPWWDEGAEEQIDMWVTAAETRAEIVDRYRRVWLHADVTINDLPADAPGQVPWWPRPDVTLHTMLVHVLAETNRHAGHADILREQLDGSVGMRSDDSNVAEHGAAWWDDLRGRIEEAAQSARS